MNWLELFDHKLLADVSAKVLEERVKYVILPKIEYVLRAFELTEFDDVKVVILGQDPYPNQQNATGLAFSVATETPLPRSLANIYSELRKDLGVIRPNGNLEDWAKQGILLLNMTLTVREKQSNSHKSIGWINFTDDIIKKISDHKEHVVFILWGKHAYDRKYLIDGSKHCILTSPHPSPQSAYTGFFGSKPFSKTNEYLVSVGKEPIKW